MDQIPDNHSPEEVLARLLAKQFKIEHVIPSPMRSDLKDQQMSGSVEPLSMIQLKKVLLNNELYPWDQVIHTVTPTKVIVDEAIYTNMSPNYLLDVRNCNNMSSGNSDSYHHHHHHHPGMMSLLASGSNRYSSEINFVHSRLEERIARFYNKEDAIVFNSIYMANLSLITNLQAKPYDIIIFDSSNHKSLIDGCKLSGARLLPYTHNRMDQVEQMLCDLREKEKFFGKVFLVAESISSVYGDLFNLPVAKKLADMYQVSLVLDDGNGFGILGKRGKGIEEHYNMPGAVDIMSINFAKALGTSGGAIVGSRSALELVRMFGRNTGVAHMAPGTSCMIAIDALTKLEAQPHRITQLHDTIQYFRNRLKTAGFLRQHDQYSSCNSPIIPLHIGEERKALLLYRYLLRHGYYASVVMYPSVPLSEAQLHLSVTPQHEKQELDRFVQVLKEFEPRYSSTYCSDDNDYPIINLLSSRM